ncbi:MAG: hypothetical protein AAF921_19285 [Cyanobacteria bacterium P01_D01_bin.44]
MKRLKRSRQAKRRKRIGVFVSGGLTLLSIGLGMGFRYQAEAAASKDLCQEVVATKAVLSRSQLGQLLTVPERAERRAVKAIVQEPYCTMAGIEVRSGVKAEREAYPLAFDPNTWLVLLYEGEEYAGYGFSFQQ